MQKVTGRIPILNISLKVLDCGGGRSKVELETYCCDFFNKEPHAQSLINQLGDLFYPYFLDLFRSDPESKWVIEQYKPRDN